MKHWVLLFVVFCIYASGCVQFNHAEKDADWGYNVVPVYSITDKSISVRTLKTKDTATTFSIQGHICESTGKDISGTWIRIHSVVSKIGVVENDGAFFIRNIPKGKYRLTLFNRSGEFYMRPDSTTLIEVDRNINVTIIIHTEITGVEYYCPSRGIPNIVRVEERMPLMIPRENIYEFIAALCPGLDISSP